MKDIYQGLKSTWQSIRAARQGIDEGLNHFVGGTFDGISRVARWGLDTAGVSVDKKGVLSGIFFKATLDEKSRLYNGYDVNSETPTMRRVREGVAMGTELTTAGAAMFVPGLNASTWAARVGGVSAGLTVDALDIGGQIVTGREEARAEMLAETAPPPSPALTLH